MPRPVATTTSRPRLNLPQTPVPYLRNMGAALMAVEAAAGTWLAISAALSGCAGAAGSEALGRLQLPRAGAGFVGSAERSGDFGQAQGTAGPSSARAPTQSSAQRRAAHIELNTDRRH
jgi:hypothetical protein